MKRTRLQSELELEFGVAMTILLHQRLRRGDSRASIAADFGVASSTVANWARKMGYGQHRVLHEGWKSIPVAHYDSPMQVVG